MSFVHKSPYFATVCARTPNSLHISITPHTMSSNVHAIQNQTYILCTFNCRSGEFYFRDLLKGDFMNRYISVPAPPTSVVQGSTSGSTPGYQLMCMTNGS